MPVSLELAVQHGLQYGLGGGLLGVMGFSAPAHDGLPAMVRVSVREPDGREWRGGLRVGEEFAVGSEIWRVRSIEGPGSDTPMAWLEQIALAEDAESGEWDYYLIDRTLVQPERFGEVVRVRRGDPLERGVAASPRGTWVATDDVYVLRVRGESGSADRISEVRARALLTDWVRIWRYRCLPDDVRPLGPLITARPWDYFLVGAPDPDVEMDVAGPVVRHRPGAPTTESFVLGPDGDWELSDLLQTVWVETADRSVFPISDVVARWLMTQRAAQGRIPHVPADVTPSAAPWPYPVARGWEYFLLRQPWDRAEDPRAGRVVRHLVGTSYKQGFGVSRLGEWSPTADLFPVLVLESSIMTAEPLDEEQARRLLTWRRERGVLKALPEGVEPLDDERGLGR